MNYYIQGDAANADKIRAAFEKFGYDISWPGGCANPDVINIGIERNGAKYVVAETSEYIKGIIKTHPDYKELELPVEPKFKVGDWVVWTEPNGDKPAEPVKIIQLIDEDQLYRVDMGNGIGHISYDMQDYYKLVQKPHYDIANFHAGMPVLVRADNNCKWDYSVFSRNTGNEYWPFAVCNGVSFTQCIPFNDDTKHLLGTTDMCDKQYINW